MFQLILLAAIIYILFQWLRQGKAPAPRPRAFDGARGPIEEMVQDPVCGMWVPISQAISLPGEKETRYFCSAACREKFLQKQADSRR
jgi:YHS domain-containing protein